MVGPTQPPTKCTWLVLGSLGGSWPLCAQSPPVQRGQNPDPHPVQGHTVHISLPSRVAEGCPSGLAVSPTPSHDVSVPMVPPKRGAFWYISPHASSWFNTAHTQAHSCTLPCAHRCTRGAFTGACAHTVQSRAHTAAVLSSLFSVIPGLPPSLKSFVHSQQCVCSQTCVP